MRKRSLPTWVHIYIYHLKLSSGTPSALHNLLEMWATRGSFCQCLCVATDFPKIKANHGEATSCRPAWWVMQVMLFKGGTKTCATNGRIHICLALIRLQSCPHGNETEKKVNLFSFFFKTYSPDVFGYLSHLLFPINEEIRVCGSTAALTFKKVQNAWVFKCNPPLECWWHLLHVQPWGEK